MGFIFSRVLVWSPWPRGESSREHILLLKEGRGDSLHICHLFSLTLWLLVFSLFYSCYGICEERKINSPVKVSQ